jgi:hypothetical protein
MREITMNKEKKLMEENIRLRKAMAVCLNKPLLSDIKEALVRIEKGKFVGKEEFLKESPLVCRR